MNELLTNKGGIMLKMYFAMIGLLLSVLTACTSHATPTTVMQGLAWDAYTDTSAAGFYVYWKDQGNATSAYNNTNRTQITDITKVSILLNAIVAATHPSSLCFVLTAYDSANNESGYSNEVCGFAGMPNPANVRRQ